MQMCGGPSSELHKYATVLSPPQDISKDHIQIYKAISSFEFTGDKNISLSKSPKTQGIPTDALVQRLNKHKRILSNGNTDLIPASTSINTTNTKWVSFCLQNHNELNQPEQEDDPERY